MKTKVGIAIYISSSFSPQIITLSLVWVWTNSPTWAAFLTILCPAQSNGSAWRVWCHRPRLRADRKSKFGAGRV